MSILENRRENLKLIIVLVLESKALYWELRHQIEWIMKITLKTLQESINNTVNTKGE